MSRLDFWDRVQQTEYCWLWTGAKSLGYGQWSIKGKPIWAHRESYRRTYGEIPLGYEIDHLCHNRDDDCLGGESCPHRLCVNPSHLEAVPKAVNKERADAHRIPKTHCVNGHEYTESNTYRYPDGERGCRVCRSNYMKSYKERQKMVNIDFGGVDCE